MKIECCPLTFVHKKSLELVVSLNIVMFG